MILCITDWCPVLDRYGHPTGRKELLVSHGFDLDNYDRAVILPCEHPSQLGAKLINGEWYLV